MFITKCILKSVNIKTLVYLEIDGKVDVKSRVNLTTENCHKLLQTKLYLYKKYEYKKLSV